MYTYCHRSSVFLALYCTYLRENMAGSLPDDHIHDEAVAKQADHKHHRVDCSDDGDYGRHALLLPAIIVGHIAAV